VQYAAARGQNLAKLRHPVLDAPAPGGAQVTIVQVRLYSLDGSAHRFHLRLGINDTRFGGGNGRFCSCDLSLGRIDGGACTRCLRAIIIQSLNGDGSSRSKFSRARQTSLGAVVFCLWLGNSGFGGLLL